MTRNRAIAYSCTAVWTGIVLTSVFSPDMVSGSEHEHLPLAAITAWIWGLAASGYLVMLAFIPDRPADAALWRGLVAAIAAVWLVGSALAILGPVLVTGSDPTRIPLAALIAPPVANIATACACILAGVLRQKEGIAPAGVLGDFAGAIPRHH